MLFITFICISSVGHLNIKHKNSQNCIQNTSLMQKMHKIVVIYCFFFNPQTDRLYAKSQYLVNAWKLAGLEQQNKFSFFLYYLFNAFFHSSIISHHRESACVQSVRTDLRAL